MAIRFRKSAVKFLAKVSPGDVSRLQEKLNQLWRSIEEQGIIPFTDLDIKKMKGDWEGFYRLRIGNIRVIFTVNLDSAELEVHDIGSRGDIYK